MPSDAFAFPVGFLSNLSLVVSVCNVCGEHIPLMLVEPTTTSKYRVVWSKSLLLNHTVAGSVLLYGSCWLVLFYKSR